MPIQAGLVENDVVEALAANRADEAFHVSSLPWRSRRREHLLDPQIYNLLAELAAKYAIPIAEQILWRLIERKCFPQLLRRPLRRRMGGDVEMHDPPSIVRQNQKHVQHLKNESSAR